MKRSIKPIWEHPVWSGVLAILIATLLIALKNPLIWALEQLWAEVFSEVWGPYLLTVIAVAGLVAFMRRSGNQNARIESAMGEDKVRELARKAAENEIILALRNTQLRENHDDLSRRVQELEYHYARLEAKESLGRAYKEGAVDSAIRMMKIGQSLDRDYMTREGLDVLRDLLQLNPTFSVDQVRSSVAMLRTLPEEFGAEALVKEIKSKPLL